MKILILLFLYIAFGLQEECCGCSEVREEVGFKESMGKRGAKTHGVAGNSYILQKGKIYVHTCVKWL